VLFFHYGALTSLKHFWFSNALFWLFQNVTHMNNSAKDCCMENMYSTFIHLMFTDANILSMLHTNAKAYKADFIQWICLPSRTQ